MAITETARPDRAEAALLAARPTANARVARPLSLHFSERKLLLGFMDTFLLNLAFLVTLVLRTGVPFAPQAVWDRLSWFAILTAVWLLCAFMFECYRLSRAATIAQSWRRTGAAVLLTWLAYLLIPYVTPALPTSRFDIVAFPLLAFAGIGSWRVLYATVLVQPDFHQRALIVGAGWAGAALMQVINEISHGAGPAHPTLGYQILGFLDDDAAKQGAVVEGVPVVGTRHDLLTLAADLRATELIVAITHAETMHGELFEAILTCRERGLAITTMATLYERLSGRVPIEHAGRALHVTLPLDQPATYRFYLAFQRLLDIAASLVGCLVLLVILPCVWLANRLTAPGPLFYTQARVGKGGRIFYVVKFRSMVEDAEKLTGEVWAAENDPRITPVGRLLRKTRLDELPQFWNILKGEMSLIGPRPERPHFVNQLAREIPFYRVRHAVKPGLTGWAQVQYRYAASIEDTFVKLQYDLFYLKHQGVLLDLKVLLKTIPIVLGLKGR